ncbi:hypothetical protein LY13_005076 [Prauserella aidingensis]|uniref:hypothetical protein n=1 Tax=Prauserella aidingensis TaxID=387890 RepID=UPI0020A4292B|nr:hypothetical protein [Prauserella aidingensis]MCP2256286.1 hypothetical protein [Prauserella aidingensis]
MSRQPPRPAAEQKPERRMTGYRIRKDLDDALNRYREDTGSSQIAAIDAALEFWLTEVGYLTPPTDSKQ